MFGFRVIFILIFVCTFGILIYLDTFIHHHTSNNTISTEYRINIMMMNQMMNDKYNYKIKLTNIGRLLSGLYSAAGSYRSAIAPLISFLVDDFVRLFGILIVLVDCV